jgi:DNA polymerase I-like protein with 3'-5' exonuclease and polymerase domains
MNYIITKNRKFFERIGDYTYAFLDDMTLPEVIAVDTETTSLSAKDGYIFSIQIGTGKNNYLIDLQRHEDESLRYTLEEVMPYFIDRQMVFHNASFDLSFFFTAGFFIKNVFDTMLASMIYYNGDSYKRHSFKECMEREMEIYYDKTEQANIATVQLSQPSTIKYCFNDVDRLLQLHERYVELLSEYGAIESYFLHCKHIRALTYMELCGLPLSAEKWKNKMDNDYKNYKDAEKIVIEYIFDNLPKYRQNQLDMFDSSKKITCLLSSSKQMIPVFKDFDINVEVVDKHEVKESLDKTVLSKSNHPFIRLWFNFKEAEHNVTTFGESIYNKIQDGRIYTHFKPIIDTARIASRKGEINFLNFPANKETRECFYANPGSKSIVADYEGQETVVGADITGDEAMIQSIVDGLDLHCAFARVLFPELESLSDDEIKKEHKSKRNASKAPRVCFQFGGTGYTLAMNEGMPVEE